MATARAGYAGQARVRSLAELGALVAGALFLVVGILGFIPGITTNVDDMKFLGDESASELLGLFQVSVLHNIVHLLFGAVGLWAAFQGWATARLFLILGGATYLVLFVYGLIVPTTSDWNFVPVNTADDWLHLVLALAMLGIGLAAGRRREDDPLIRQRGVRGTGLR